MKKRISDTILLKSVPTEYDVYFDMALTMLEEIVKRNEKGEKTVMIVPVGPTQQYPILAEKINAAKQDLSHVWFINMDEYLDENDQNVDDKNLSFHHSMEVNFYGRLLPHLRPAADRCLFPDPNDPAAIDQLLEDLGGADISLTGVGINGHIAFNEAAEPGDDITDEEFAAQKYELDMGIPKASKN